MDHMITHDLRSVQCSQVHLNKSATGLQLAHNEARSENRSIIIYNHFVIHSDFIGQVTGRIGIIAKKFKIMRRLFLPREWLAAKGLLRACMHDTDKNVVHSYSVFHYLFLAVFFIN